MENDLKVGAIGMLSYLKELFHSMENQKETDGLTWNDIQTVLDHILEYGPSDAYLKNSRRGE